MAPVIRGEQTAVREFFIGAIDSRYLVDDGEYRWLYHVADGSEQLFAASDRRDEHPLALDAAVIAPLRQHLIDYLISVGSSDVLDGALANHGRTPPDRASLRAQNPMGLGHAGRFVNFTGAV